MFFDYPKLTDMSGCRTHHHFGRYSHKKSTYQLGTFIPALSIQWTRLEPMMATAAAKPVATMSAVHRLVEAWYADLGSWPELSARWAKSKPNGSQPKVAQSRATTRPPG